MAWRNTAAAIKLREQIDKRWPARDQRSDGTIGDADHASRQSDHNPDARGWVKALDIDADLDSKDPGAAARLADELVAYARSRKPGAERIKYVVYNNRIASGTYADQFWTWRSGPYGHTHHIHVSFTAAAERDASPFPLDCLSTAKPLPIVELSRLGRGKPAHADVRIVQKALRRYVAPRLDVDGQWGPATSRAWARAVVKSGGKRKLRLLRFLGSRYGFRATA